MTDPDRITTTTTRPTDYRPRVDDLVLCYAATIGDDVPRYGIITGATDATGRVVVDCGRHGLHAAAAIEYDTHLPPATAGQTTERRIRDYLAAELAEACAMVAALPPFDALELGPVRPWDDVFPAGDQPSKNTGKKRSKRKTPAKRKVCHEK
ncbi:hypothetical protein [Desulfuromonas thiophila]|uniref:hypothetical protein n=1 Tax=Desulfuromonas thiophila TaxID=57664 RepID=UPI0029F598F1|nr:hypothetical protein [Desulfuromonas thiophila]